MIDYAALEKKLAAHMALFLAQEGLDALELAYAALGRPSHTVLCEVKFARPGQAPLP